VGEDCQNLSYLFSCLGWHTFVVLNCNSSFIILDIVSSLQRVLFCLYSPPSGPLPYFLRLCTGEYHTACLLCLLKRGHALFRWRVHACLPTAFPQPAIPHLRPSPALPLVPAYILFPCPSMHSMHTLPDRCQAICSLSVLVHTKHHSPSVYATHVDKTLYGSDAYHGSITVPAPPGLYHAVLHDTDCPVINLFFAPCYCTYQHTAHKHCACPARASATVIRFLAASVSVASWEACWTFSNAIWFAGIYLSWFIAHTEVSAASLFRLLSQIHTLYKMTL